MTCAGGGKCPLPWAGLAASPCFLLGRTSTTQVVGPKGESGHRNAPRFLQQPFNRRPPSIFLHLLVGVLDDREVKHPKVELTPSLTRAEFDEDEVNNIAQVVLGSAAGGKHG